MKPGLVEMWAPLLVESEAEAEGRELETEETGKEESLIGIIGNGIVVLIAARVEVVEVGSVEVTTGVVVELAAALRAAHAGGAWTVWLSTNTLLVI